MPDFVVSDFAIDAFTERVRQTAAWCNRVHDTSPELLPLRSNFLRSESLVEYDRLPTRQRHAERRSHMVEALAAKRANELERFAHLRAPFALTREELRAGMRGRLLLFDPDSTAIDGAATAPSGGFFDDYNEPPWDTWVAYVWDDTTPGTDFAYFWSCLVTWVPARFLDQARRGVDVNPERCIAFAAELDIPLTRLLRQHGFL